ncbi:MAG: response regulator transcription factor, partial [Candidatus Acidiferrales bacterium]
GVELFKKLRPDVVIVDFQMPGLNGVETARLILQIASAAPIVMFTDHASAELEKHALEAGIRAVVSKIDTFLMVGIIKAILGSDDSTPHDEVSSATI